MDWKLMPEVRIALISLSALIRPYDMRIATSTAIGIASARIHIKFKPMYSKITQIDNPFPKS